MSDLICPYCQYAQRDVWEIDFGPGLEGDVIINCGDCEKEFKAYRNVLVSYKTYKIKQ